MLLRLVGQAADEVAEQCDGNVTRMRVISRMRVIRKPRMTVDLEAEADVACWTRAVSDSLQHLDLAVDPADKRVEFLDVGEDVPNGLLRRR